MSLLVPHLRRVSPCDRTVTLHALAWSPALDVLPDTNRVTCIVKSSLGPNPSALTGHGRGPSLYCIHFLYHSQLPDLVVRDLCRKA